MMKLLNWRLTLLALPLFLTSCLITPTKFTSTLDIRADRSFTFTYVGEVMAMDDKSMSKGLTSGLEDNAEEAEDGAASADDAADASTSGAGTVSKVPVEETEAESTKENEAKLQALAEALSEEYGYRSARYIGNNRIAIDYAISGRLDRGFTYPFNADAEIILPFIAIELRGKDRVRVKAPAFANQSSSAGSIPGAGGSAGEELDGTFTLTTNAEIISQNQEKGATALPNGSKSIVWRVTPALKSEPMAVVKLSPLP